jgi:hypothetical protein
VIDLTAAGVDAVHTPFTGEITPQHPLVLRLVMQPDLDGPTGAEYADIDVPVTGPGDVTVPLSAFGLSSSAMNFDAIGAVSVMVSECGSTSCGEPVPPRTFAMGALSFVTAGATPVQHSTWGALKARYR